MYRKTASIALIVAISLTNVSTIQASTVQEYEDLEERVEKLKKRVIEKGTGEKSRWEVQLKDGRKIKGYTSEIREDAFTLVNWKTHNQYDVSFDEITSLRSKSSLPVAVQIAIFGGIIVVAVAAIVGFATRD